MELKLVVLLVHTCYETTSIQTKIANNAEERANQISLDSKLKLEEKRKIREASIAMKETAIERCRAINEAEAMNSKPKAVQKKLNFKGLHIYFHFMMPFFNTFFSNVILYAPQKNQLVSNQ